MPLNIFITGGTTGIGLKLTELYLQEGHRVGICGRNLTKLSSTFLKQSSLKAYQCDVTDREELHRVVKAFSQGNLDMAIANAGISMGKKTCRPDFKLSRQVLETNIFGVLHVFEAALPIMLSKRKGQLVALSSVAAMVGLPGGGAYSASKAAIFKLCESYAIDLRNENIHITCICPGFIKTPLTEKNNHPMPFLLSVEDGAKRIKKAIDQKKVIYIFPWPMKIVMTVLEKIPRSLYRFLMRSSFFNYTRQGATSWKLFIMFFLLWGCDAGNQYQTQSQKIPIQEKENCTDYETIKSIEKQTKEQEDKNEISLLQGNADGGCTL